MVDTRRHYTVDEWLDLPEDEERHELVDGALRPEPDVTMDHEAVRDGLTRLLMRAEDAGYGVYYRGRLAVVLDPRGARRNGRRPDLYFLRREHEGRITNPCCEGAPDLVIEIPAEADRADVLPGGRKFADYECFGVPHYWIADPQTRTLAQYALQAGRYGPPALLQGEDRLHSPLFPGLSLPVGRVFAGVRAPERPLGEGAPFAIPAPAAAAR